MEVIACPAFIKPAGIARGKRVGFVLPQSKSSYQIILCFTIRTYIRLVYISRHAMTSTNMEIHICEWSYLSRYLNFCPQSMRIAHTQKYVLSLCGVETVTNNLWRCSTVEAGKFGFRLGINQPYCTTHLWLSDRLLMYFCLCWGRGHQKKSVVPLSGFSI